jgi:putative permease
VKKIAQNTAIILATASVLVLLWQFRDAVILFLLSLGAAATARPWVDGLIRKGVRKSLSILIVYTVSIGTIIGLFVLVSGNLITDLQKISNDVIVNYQHIWDSWPHGNQIQQTIASFLPPPQDALSSITGKQPEGVVQTVLGFTLGSFTLISQFFAVLILSIYWSLDQVHFERLWLSILSVETRAKAREIWRDIEQIVGAYTRSELIQSLLAAILLGIGFSLLKLNYPILLGLIAALFWLIPWIGALLALIPICIVGFSMNPWIAIAAAIYTILVLLGMELGIEPRLFDRKNYSSLLIVLFMLALVDVLGFIGLLAAPPMAVAVQMIFRHIFSPPIQIEEMETAHQIANLGEKVTQIHELLDDLEEAPSPQSVNMLARLDQLIDKAHLMMEKNG